MEENTQSNTRNNSTTRFQRETVDASNGDSWWWQIENEDLILDHQPYVTTLSWHQTEDDVRGETDLNALPGIRQHTRANNENTNDNFDTSNDLNSGKILSDESSQNEEGAVATHLSNTWSVKDSRNETQSLDEFKEELRQKRLARQTALQDLRDEIATLRKQLKAEQKLTRQLLQQGNKTEASSLQISSEIHMENETNETDGVEAKYRTNFKENEEESNVSRSETYLVDITSKSVERDVKNGELDTPELRNIDEDDENACSRSRHANIELANAQLALQLATSENLSLTTELGVTQKQVATLKEVVACCKQMLALKEDQCKQLKTKLNEIEESLAERETKMMSDKLRQEYERQLGNIRQLRQLYEERQRIAASEQENLQRLISIKRDELAGEKERTKNLEERNEALLKEVEAVNKELAALREECNEHKFEKRALKEEMGAINTLFSQMVMGFHGKNNLDIDRLATMLEENRMLLNDMVSRETSCSDGATLPKLLFELVEQAAVGSQASSRSSSPATEEEEKEQDYDGWMVERGAKGDVRASVGETDDAARNENGEEILRDIQHNTLEDAEAPSENMRGNTEKSAVSNISSEQNDNNKGCCNSSSKDHCQHRRSSFKKLKKNTSSSTCVPSDTISSTLKFHQPEVLGKVASTQEIIGNLPKVWKVLIELLSHHKVEKVQFEESGASEDCYKSVQTPNGLKAELSVSKTYIKLKDLILEKKSLVKETNRLKALNSHLDYRLNEQEKRLSVVSLELTKTWHLVGKMQRQHRQLHTQEQILRYQLQQKRRLLSELKEELEYCRRKWAAARAKNDESQDQCNDLRREFARRKLEDANNSAESGYSDSGPQSDEETLGQPLSEATRKSNKLHQIFEHSRQIKRMQSTSPGRAYRGERVLLRWNSAPPTCGWRLVDDDDDGDQNDEAEVNDMNDDSGLKDDDILSQNSSRRTNGAIPKQSTIRPLESKTNTSTSAGIDDTTLTDSAFRVSPLSNTDPADCIQRLEEQCKSLIRKVMETTDTRERLEVQLCHFQDVIAPAQYAVPLNELITSKRLERLTRASSAPESAGTLTPREEEYTRKRSERLERLEEESRQLISRIKRTSDRGHYLRCSLDRLHKTRSCGQSGSDAVSREGSFESNNEEEEANQAEAQSQVHLSEELERSTRCLTEAEEVYVARRSERLKRLENEGKQLLEKLTKSVQRGSTLSNQLDVLHEHHGHVEASDEKRSTNSSPPPPPLEKRIEDIERVAANRSERLRILQEEGDLLIARLNNTAERGTQMINRIDSRDQNRAIRQKGDIENIVVNESTDKPRCSTPIPTNNNMSRDEVREEAAIPVATAADPLLPTLKNVACSCIVFDELAECVTVTTTTSQIAQASNGQSSPDRPKPLAQLSVIAHSKGKAGRDGAGQTNSTESLEEMVKRLQNLPFPDVQSAQTTKEKVDAEKTEDRKTEQ